MGKSRNRKWYDKFDSDNDVNDYRSSKSKKTDRREARKIRQAVKHTYIEQRPYYDDERDDHS